MLLHACVSLSGAPSPVKLKYSFTPVVHDGQLTLRVVLDTAGITPNRTELVLPSSWGYAIRLTGAVVDLRAESSGAQIVDTVDTSIKVLQGYVRGRARVSWYLVKDWDGPLRESVRHRVHLDPNYIEVTSNALVHPRLDQSAFVDCTFQWNVLPQWSIATSFGAGTQRQTYRGPWDTVQNALFVAGDFRIHKLKMGKGSLVIAIRGKWSVPDEQAISQIVNIIRVERAFWKNQDFPYFLVTLVPFGQRQDGSGGVGFTNAFSLHTSPEGTFSAGLLSLLAHGVFHTWNPYKLVECPTNK
jgi:predicted metalloprotease with PDZ domain